MYFITETKYRKKFYLRLLVIGLFFCFFVTPVTCHLFIIIRDFFYCSMLHAFINTLIAPIFIGPTYTDHTDEKMGPLVEIIPSYAWSTTKSCYWCHRLSCLFRVEQNMHVLLRESPTRVMWLALTSPNHVVKRLDPCYFPSHIYLQISRCNKGNL